MTELQARPTASSTAPSAGLPTGLISGNTSLIAHIGYPTYTFKSPMIYNPYFAHAGIDTVVVPMGCKPDHFAALLKSVFALENICGALITMPHKVTTVGLLDEVSAAVRIAGACNAVRRTADGRLQGDLFDGEGFVRGVQRKGVALAGARVLVVGNGGVGSAIAASLAAAGVGAISLFDERKGVSERLGQRIQAHYPNVAIQIGSKDPAGHQLVVNATPLGMKDGDPLPVDVERLSHDSFVGEVVMRGEMTPFLLAAQAKGCAFQIGTDMLFEQIPAYLEYFGLPTTTAEVLRSLARIPA